MLFVSKGQGRALCRNRPGRTQSLEAGVSHVSAEDDKALLGFMAGSSGGTPVFQEPHR